MDSDDDSDEEVSTRDGREGGCSFTCSFSVSDQMFRDYCVQINLASIHSFLKYTVDPATTQANWKIVWRLRREDRHEF